jgi:hypothetical protein
MLAFVAYEFEVLVDKESYRTVAGKSSISICLAILIDSLRPSGNYISHMLWKSVMLHFVFFLLSL